MHIAIFGATGRAGRVFVTHALDQGHHVTALVRDPARLDSLVYERLRVVAGDVRNPEAVAATVAGAEAIVSMLGSTRATPHTCAEGIGAILPAMAGAGAGRLIVLSNYGVAESRRRTPYVVVSWLLQRAILRDKERMEAQIRSSAVGWTILRAPILTDGPRTGNYRVGTDLSLTFTSRVSRADLAEFVLSALTRNDFTRRAVAITR